MAGTQLKELQIYIQALKELSQSAGSARPQIEGVIDILQKLTTVRGIVVPKQEDLDTFRTLGLEVAKLGGAYRELAIAAGNALGSINQLRIKAYMPRGVEDFWGPVGFTIPPGGGGFGVAGRQLTAGVTGDLASMMGGFGAEGLPGIETNVRLMTSLQTAIDTISKSYGDLGFKLVDVKGNLDATNKAWDLQIQMMKKVSDSLTLVKNVAGRVSVESGQVIPQSSLLTDLQERLGPRYDEFVQKLQKMKISTEDLKSVQVDAVNGIARFSFSTTTASGAVRTANFHIDNLGRSLGDTSTRFKAFDAMLLRNIDKVMQWGIAVGLVLGIWRQLQQMFQNMASTQELAADLAVVTGKSIESMGTYMESTSAIARQFGTNLMETSKAMTVALRATAGSGEVQQTREALELLADSAALAKLGAIGMTEATDILVSALRQMGEPLTSGDALLNKWVAVSKNAYVSVVDLGQAFSTTAAAAQGAGVDVDELNGLIAAMAEVTKLSAEENANALRALFAAIQQPSTQEALASYGIAVHDASGEMRDMMAILRDLNMLVNDFGEGTILSEKALGKLGYSLGGQGARRASQMTSLIKNLDRAFELSNVSVNASGDLQVALEIKTSTLRTETERLTTAFTDFGRTLGGKGGLLELLTSIVKLTAGLVDGFGSVSAALGPATATLVTYTAAWWALSKLGMQERMWQWGKGMRAAGLGMEGGKGTAMQFAGLGLQKAGMPAMYGAITGLGTYAATGDWTQAAGAALGAAFGFSVGGPIGGMIGATIAEAFMNSVVQSKEKFTLAFETPISELTSTQLEETRAYLEEELRKLQPGVGGIALAAPLPVGTLREQFQRQLDDVNRQIAELRRAEGLGAEGALPPETYTRLIGYKQYLPALEREFKAKKMELPFEFARGEIASAREYTTALSRMDSLLTSILPVFDAIVLSLREQGTELEDARGQFVDMGREMSDWSDESVQFIVEQALAIQQLQTQLEETGQGYDELSQKLAAFPRLYERMRTTEAAEQITIPGFTAFTDMTQEEFNQLIEMATELQQQFAQQLGIPQEAFDSMEGWVAFVAGNFTEIEGVMQQFVQQAQQMAEQVKSSMEDAFEVRRLKDVDPSKMAEIARGSRYWLEYLARMRGMSAQQYLNMEGRQFNLILGPQNVLQQIYSTNEAMLFTLQDIQDVEEKQLEGMWNIPSGATFWVPLTSLFYQRGEGGGFPELPELLPPTERTAENTTDIAETNREAVRELVNVENAVNKIRPTIDLDQWRTMLDEYMMRRVKEPTDEWMPGWIAGEDIVDQYKKMRLAEPTSEWVLKSMLGTQFDEYKMRRIKEPTEEFIPPWIKRIGELTGVGARLELPEAKPMIDYASILDTALTGLESFAMSLLSLPLTGVAVGVKGTRELPEIPTPQEPTAVDVAVDIPEISGSFTIQNVVTLDGRQISMYVNKLFAQALAKVARATGRTTTRSVR